MQSQYPQCFKNERKETEYVSLKCIGVIIKGITEQKVSVRPKRNNAKDKEGNENTHHHITKVHKLCGTQITLPVQTFHLHIIICIGVLFPI